MAVAETVKKTIDCSGRYVLVKGNEPATPIAMAKNCVALCDEALRSMRVQRLLQK